MFGEWTHALQPELVPPTAVHQVVVDEYHLPCLAGERSAIPWSSWVFTVLTGCHDTCGTMLDCCVLTPKQHGLMRATSKKQIQMKLQRTRAQQMGIVINALT